MDLKEKDAGEYSCEMIEKVDGIEKTREYITVTIFMRQSEEEEEEEENEDSDYIEILDLKSTGTLRYQDPSVVNGSSSNYKIKCSSKNMSAQVVCVLYVFLYSYVS